MELTESISGAENVIEQTGEQTEKSVEEIRFWSWSDVLLALKQNQDLPTDITTCAIVQKCLDSLVRRLALAAEASPCTSSASPESFGFRISCDSRSTESLKTSCSRSMIWWFDDLLVLNENLIQMAVNLMVSRMFDHGIISRFLFHYQKSKFIGSDSDDKCRIIEMVINSLCSLDNRSVSYKNLMGILRISLTFNINKCTRSRLEGMIGLRMDEATLDNLLVPSPLGANYLYDVNLVLRFLKSFLGKVSSDRIIRVAHLLDLYLAEVAPDPSLKPFMFIALATALPDSSRESYDDMYHAIDMYLQVHTDLSEEETFKICSALNYEKLSREACVHLSKNTMFPSRNTVQALLCQQTKLKSLPHDANHPKPCSSSPYSCTRSRTKSGKNEETEKIVLHAGKLDFMFENEDIRAHLQGMQCRVAELEKVCQKMQIQVENMMQSKSSSNINAKSLPRLCS